MSKKITEALELHDELNQKLFNGTELKQEVKDKLLEIADTFVESLDFPINVADIRFLGSNASYNYNEHSDIDLHIISNFDLLNIDKDMLQTLYNACKNSFNNNHDITIKGIPVELYIEDMKSNNATKASYSLLNDEWVLFPEPVDYEIPDISQELQDVIDEINTTLSSTDKEEVESLINKVYLARKDGLASEGEASKGNCVFKELRNMGLIDKLRERFYDLESQELTLEKKKVEEHYVPSEYNDEDIKAKEQEYREYIATHIANVHNAYNRIVMQFVEEEYKNDLETNLDNHDKDKLQSFIFDAYRRNHLPVEEKEKDDADEDYEIAWFYHKKNNPHHWEYWLGGNDKPIEDVNEYDIKLAYYEMLCDWLSFGFRKDKTSATGESNEFETWYSESKENMIIHPEYKEWLDSIISDIIGYIKDNKKEIYNEDGLETMEKYLTNIETYGKIEKESLDVNSRKEGENKMTETKKLEEGGMSRIVQLIQQGYFGTVSASLNPLRYAFFVAKDKKIVEMLNGDFKNSTSLSGDIIAQIEEKYSGAVESYNKDAIQQLKNSIRQTGFGYVPLEGVYTYNGTEEGSVEESLFVSVSKNIRSSLDDFRQQIINIGNTYFQESVVVGNADMSNNGEVTKDENGQLVISASLYDCVTGKVLDTDEYSTDFSSIDINAISGFLSKLIKDNNRTFTLKECDDIFMGKKITSYTDGLKAGGVHQYWSQHKNPVAESYRKKKLQEMTYKEFKQDTGFALDFNVKVPLNFTQESDTSYIEDEKGNEIETDIDIDSLNDAEMEAQHEVEEMMQDEDYLKDIFPNVGRGRVYVEIIGLEEDELEFNIGFSDIVDPVEQGNDIKINKDEIIEQIKDLAEGIVENIGYIDAKQTYDEYSGYKDEDDDPIFDTEYSDNTVSFLYSINTEKEITITPISEKVTESKKLEETNLSRIFSHYQNDPFIVISAERPDADNKKNTLKLKNNIRSAGFGYVPVGGNWKENNEISTEASFFIPMPYGTEFNDFFNWGIRMCGVFNQDSVLISNGQGDIAYYGQDGNSKMKFSNGVSFNQNTIDKNMEDAGGVGGYTSLNNKNSNKSFQLQQLKINKDIIKNLANDNASCDVLRKYVDEYGGVFSENDLQLLVNTLYNSKLDLKGTSGGTELSDCKITFDYLENDDMYKVSLRESKDLIKYKNHSQRDYVFNKNYSNNVKIEESDTNYDILSKYKNADYGFIKNEDLQFIVETLYGKETKLTEGINEYSDLKLEYKDGRIIDLQQK